MRLENYFLDKRITREHYNLALDVVEAYQKQLFQSGRGVSKTYTADWVDRIEGIMSTRLQNALRSKHMPRFLEDITEKSFLRVRGVGKKAWKEFGILRGGGPEFDY